MTLSISDIKKIEIWYVAATVFVLAFGFIYEYYSHQVYSIFMQYAFIVPLLGFVTYLVMYKNRVVPNKLFVNLFNCSIVTLTLGSIMKGFLDIYGTTNGLIIVYVILGLLLMFVSIVGFKKS